MLHDQLYFTQARLSAALRWMLNVAYGPSIPEELKEPLPLKEVCRPVLGAICAFYDCNKQIDAVAVIAS